MYLLNLPDMKHFCHRWERIKSEYEQNICTVFLIDVWKCDIDTEGGKWHTTENCFDKLQCSIRLEHECIHWVCAMQFYKYCKVSSLW